MLTVPTIFLIALNFSHAYAVLTPSERSRLASHEKRALTSWVSMTKGSDWPCSSSQLKNIEKSIEYAKILANGAMVALDNTGTSSKAYVRWFGKTNTNKAQLSTIKTSHFGAPNRFLQTPSSTIKSHDEGGPSPQRLVYACPPKDFPLCNGEVAAAAINAGDETFKTNILLACPSFFKKTSNSQMLSNWRKGKYTPSAGMILLHETQHLDAIVGKGKRCVDLAYPVDKCEKLADKDKIRNAQNYAFFALDVTAIPPKRK